MGEKSKSPKYLDESKGVRPKGINFPMAQVRFSRFQYTAECYEDSI